MVICTLYSCSLSAPLDIISIFAHLSAITALSKTSLVSHDQCVIQRKSLGFKLYTCISIFVNNATILIYDTYMIKI